MSAPLFSTLLVLSVLIALTRSAPDQSTLLNPRPTGRQMMFDYAVTGDGVCKQF